MKSELLETWGMMQKAALTDMKKLPWHVCQLINCSLKQIFLSP